MMQGPDERLRVRVLFLRAVHNYYELQVQRCMGDFRRLKENLKHSPSGKIRIRHCHPDGEIWVREGYCVSRRGQLFLKDRELGTRMLVSNSSKWTSLGKPVSVSYSTGFSYDGLRARIIKAAVDDGDDGSPDEAKLPSKEG